MEGEEREAVPMNLRMSLMTALILKSPRRIRLQTTVITSSSLIMIQIATISKTILKICWDVHPVTAVTSMALASGDTGSTRTGGGIATTETIIGRIRRARKMMNLHNAGTTQDARGGKRVCHCLHSLLTLV